VDGAGCGRRVHLADARVGWASFQASPEQQVSDSDPDYAGCAPEPRQSPTTSRGELTSCAAEEDVP